MFIIKPSSVVIRSSEPFCVNSESAVPGHVKQVPPERAIKLAEKKCIH